MDFIVELPKSGEHDSILTIVNRFSKMVVFVPTTKDVTVLVTAKLVFQHIF